MPAWPWEVRTAAAGQGARVKFAPVWMAAQLGLFVRARGLSVCKSQEGGLRPCVGRGYGHVRGETNVRGPYVGGTVNMDSV